MAEIVVTAVILGSFFLIWPVGHYTIEDDWAYAQSLLILHESGEVRILQWNPMTLVTHLFWGLLFTKTLGFSFTVTKISVVVMLWFECLLLIAVLRHVGAREPWIVLASLALLLNPLHLFQGFLYGTDVPAAAWGLLALLGYLRGLTARPISWPWIVAGSFGVAMGWGIRQSGILVAAALGAYLLFHDRKRLFDLRFLLAAFLLPGLAIVGFSGWYFLIHGPTVMFERSRQDVLNTLLGLGAPSALAMLYCLSAYLAFLALPVLLAVPWSSYRPRWGSPRGIATVTASVAVMGLFGWLTWGVHLRFPYLRNKITQFGLLSPNEILVGDRPVLWSSTVGWVVSGVLCLGVVALILLLTRRPEEDDPGETRTVARRLIGWLFCLQGIYAFLTQGILFDRHLLLFLPTILLLIVLAVPTRVRARPILAALCLGLYGFYGIATTHDLHAMSRRAFELGTDLMQEGVDAQQIDAGSAFDGWHMHARSWAETRFHRQPSLARPGDGVWVHMLTPRLVTRYVVSLSPRLSPQNWAHGVAPWARSYVALPRLQDYRVVREESWFSYWPWGERPIYVLEDRRLSADDG